jgi:formylglycine-generating enzyme required for sulfatase activity
MKRILLTLTFFTLLLYSCTEKSSPTTGWDYNNPMNGGFQKVPYMEQETGPGLVLIAGGTFQTYLEQDSMITDKTMEVVLASYYLDEKEVSNQDYLEYLYWLKRTFGVDFPLVHTNALPDTLSWEGEIGLAGNFINNYLRHPAYRDYPVVGVSWMQANNYCDWRTDRVNEFILIREGVLQHNPNQFNEDHFNTEAYLANQYHSAWSHKEQLPDLDPSKGYGKRDLATRIVRMEDGILLPHYRLPTEMEWEYAASAGTTLDKKQQKKLDETLFHLGQMVNKKYSDDETFNAHSVVPVDAFIPNDYGVYNLSGNVSEWVADTYIERTEEVLDVHSPFIGENTKVPVETFHYNYEEKLSLVIYDIPQFDYFISELKELYKKDYPNDTIAQMFFTALDVRIEEAKGYEAEGKYLDAAFVMNMLSQEYIDEFQAYYNANGHSNFGYNLTHPVFVEFKKYLARSILELPGNILYSNVTPYDRIRFRNNMSANYPFHDSIVKENDLRVVKGANWSDTEKWVQPSFRRTMNKFETSPLVGFRCAMDRVGSPVGLGSKKKK